MVFKDLTQENEQIDNGKSGVRSSKVSGDVWVHLRWSVALDMNESDVVSRRLELLKLEGLGLTVAEIVKQLSQKYECAERTIYNDFETRASWQLILQSVIKPEDVVLKIVNRYEHIYRQASLRVLSSPNPLAQLCALNTMIKVNSLMFETLVLPDLLSRLRVVEQKAAKGVFVP